MIRIEDFVEWPVVEWNETSTKEFLTGYDVREALLRDSFPVKVLYNDTDPLCVCGLYRQSLVGYPCFWALFTRHFSDFSPSTLRVLRKIAKTWPSCYTYVEQGNAKAERLARCFGFAPMEGAILIDDRLYSVYGRF